MARRPGDISEELSSKTDGCLDLDRTESSLTLNERKNFRSSRWMDFPLLQSEIKRDVFREGERDIRTSGGAS